MKITAKQINDGNDAALILDLRKNNLPVKQFLFTTDVSDEYTKAKVKDSILSLSTLLNIVKKHSDIEIEVKDIRL